MSTLILRDTYLVLEEEMISLDKLMSEIESKLAKDNITDQDQYILNSSNF